MDIPDIGVVVVVGMPETITEFYQVSESGYGCIRFLFYILICSCVVVVVEEESLQELTLYSTLSRSVKIWPWWGTARIKKTVSDRCC